MKTNVIMAVLFVCVTTMSLYSQTYSPADSIALLEIDAACDASNQLNWNIEPNPADWTGVTWNNSTPKRVNWLEINNKSLTGILDVTSLSEMTELWCYGNQLTGLSLSGLTNLWRLMCRDNQLTGIDVSSLTGLEELYCDKNQIDSLDVSSVPGIEYLTCSHNLLTSLNFSGLTGLLELDCSYNLLDTLVISENADLTSLNCSNNLLASLTVINAPSLVTLNCANNLLESLNLTNLGSLVILYCNSNRLTSLELSGLNNLTTLFCNYNQFTSLNVKNLPALTNLYCHGNQLTSFDVSSMTSLTELSCHSNQLTSLNLSGCTNMVTLYCCYNKLSSLDLTGLSSLTTLFANNNQFTNYDFSSLTNVTSLTCYKNKLPLSSLATALHIDNVYYEPMDTIFSPLTLAGTYLIDYSGEAQIQDSVTTFTFYKDDLQVDINNTGLYTTSGPGVYYCMMNNGYFPGLVLTTAKTTITDEAATLSVSPAEIYLDAAENNSGIFTIASNTAWTISDPESWLTTNLSSGILDDTITVTATANPDFTSRSAIVTISSGGLDSEIVTVTQAGNQPIAISQEINTGISIYPNPVDDIITLIVAQEVLPEAITIFNSTGTQLMQLKTIGKRNEIDLAGFNPGIYILRIVTSGNVIDKKIVKY